jgi:hypothetical protein
MRTRRDAILGAFRRSGPVLKAATPLRDESSRHLIASQTRAALLITHGCRLVGLAPLAGGRWSFVIDGDPQLVQQVLEQYHRGVARVPAKALFDAQRLLRHALRERKRGQGGPSRID